MMVVSPLMDHSGTKRREKPRIISEIRKSKKESSRVANADGRPRISGSLEWGVDGSSPWERRQVEVRDGSLVARCSPSGCPELRIPLRHLNLQPGSRPRAFSLSRDHAPPVATFQAGSEQEYERWVKTLAVELMRQTPLEAIRFLDILGITTSMYSDRAATHPPLRRGASEDNLIAIGRESRSRTKTPRIFSPNNHNYLTPKAGIECRINKDNIACDKFRNGVSLRKVGSNFILNNLKDKSANAMICEEDDGLLEKRQNTYNTKSLASDSDESDDVEKEFAELIFKCQQVDKYVPVREKRRLFESLCRGRRLAQSTENLYGSTLSNSSDGQLRRPNRAQSLHDLSRMRCSVAVSEICRFFEQRGKGGDQGDKGNKTNVNRRRLQRSERRLSRIKQEAVDVEEELWRIQDEMSALDIERSSHQGEVTQSHRSSAVKRYNALESRLTQEEERLTRLQTDAARALKEVETAANKFETALTQSNGDSVENNGRQ